MTRGLIMNHTVTFGEYVRRLRRKKGWGLRELAEASGLSVSHLSRLQNDTGVPRPETVVKLAEVLDGDLELMLGLSGALPVQILKLLGP